MDLESPPVCLAPAPLTRRCHGIFLVFLVGWFLVFSPQLAGAEDTKAAGTNGHWIVVTAPAFIDAIQPLVTHRKAEGFDVTVLNTADLLTADEIQHNRGQKLLETVRKQWQNDPAHSYVLLVGTVVAPHAEDAAATQVPILAGSIGRMKGLPSDNGYGCVAGEWLPTVPVGRWPVRTVAEAKSLVTKTLAFEEDGQGKPGWRRSLNLLVGSPGGRTPMEKSLGDWYVNNTVQATSRQINPLWEVRSIYHIPSSPWYVSDSALHEQSMAFLQTGQMFTLHLGHSSPEGFWSDGARFLDADDWKNLNMPHGAGILMTCGCFSCQLDPAGREDHEGYGLAAIRSKAGPVAVIGASAESYSVAGYCAFNGLLPVFSNANLPERLGQCWLNVKTGIAKGEVGPFTFRMFDYGDGSNGKIDLDTQRKEDLEMWMLLGDPALRLQDVTPEITLHAPAAVKAGDAVTVHGEMPDGLHIQRVIITIERPLGVPPADLVPLPEENGPKRNSTIMSNFKKSQNLILQSQVVDVTAGKFTADLHIPTGGGWDGLVIRATVVDVAPKISGVTRLKVSRK